MGGAEGQGRPNGETLLDISLFFSSFSFSFFFLLFFLLNFFFFFLLPLPPHPSLFVLAFSPAIWGSYHFHIALHF
ncbi:hypothetical protein LZ31DRAFT_92554 [Colletotrichum somersetense]|nr:hypothetical protein LZ31DRAFT_92554 [Colletotrichum somersetense]